MPAVQHSSGANAAENKAAKVPPDTVVYAVGDIHGCLVKLKRLHLAIKADAARRPASRRVVVYLGDYVDRGPDSFGVVEFLIRHPLFGFESVYLKGNHEDFLLRFLDDAGVADAWLMNGGDTTLESYDVAVFGPRRGEDRAEALRHDFAAAIPAAHREFLSRLKTWHIEGDYAFVHAGVRPGTPIEAQREVDLLWIRHEFLGSSADFGHVVVHGHTPTWHPEVRPNRVGIDTGAVYGGELTALALDGEKRDFLTA
jgi:serine/threonine protein phosphatase 1